MSHSFLGFDDGDFQSFLPSIANSRRCSSRLSVIDGQQMCRMIDHVPVPFLQTAVVVIMADILNHFEDALNARAKAFIRKKAREINERLWQIGLLREEVARMEVTPGEHHARRTIMRSVAGQNMKTVNLEIQKGDESAILKIETSALRCMDNSYYSPWRMDAPSRYKLVERFGRNTDVYPDDVVKITYGRKVLYERNAEVSKS